MLYPCRVRLGYWFYPIGNTPAVNLLKDKAPNADSTTRILCLASGDVRNVLYTLWTEPPTQGRSYELTSCDSEPAVIARNVFLYSFLISAHSENEIGLEDADLLWDLYYHFYIGAKARSTLTTHLTRLTQASTSIEAWNKSRYGSILKFVSKASLEEVRQYWQLYLGACNDKDNNNKRSEVEPVILEVFSQSGFGTEGVLLTGTRSAGIHALSESLGPTMSAAFREYWKTGVVAGNKKDLSVLKMDGEGYVNPLLNISSAPLGKFAVHYGTDPLQGYHLAEVFDEPENQTSMSEKLATVAKAQFRTWCQSFIQHIRIETIQLSFHCGDAINFCYILQRQGDRAPSTPEALTSYSRPWSSSVLELLPPESPNADCRFDIIDTSNISDHVGILNLLPAALPLLDESAFPVFYTETLLRAANETDKYLDDLLRADISTVCLMVGMAPAALLFGSSTEHFASEGIVTRVGNTDGSQSQMRIRLTWRKPNGGDMASMPSSQLLKVDSDDLASFFFQWYLNIFSEFENLSSRFSVLLRQAVNPLARDLCHDTRTTLVALIGLAKRNIQTNWSKCIESLLDRIESDRTLLVGSNSLQELYTMLHLSGIYKISTLEMLPKDAATAATQFAASNTSSAVKGLARYPDLPSIVAVVLIVPRDRLRVITSAAIERIGSPTLQLAVYNAGIFENSFFSIHASFGNLTVANDTQTGHIEEDPLGWKGHADLVVSALVPAFQFLIGKRNPTRVALAVASSAANTYFLPILGPHMRLFDTSVHDHQRLHLLRAPPDIGCFPRASSGDSRNEVLHTQPSVSVVPVAGRRELTSRQDFSQESERALLSTGALVEVSQGSACTMTVKIGTHHRSFRYPFPIDGSRSRTKISRKNFWIEVTVPMSSAMQPNGYALQPFPVVKDKEQLVPWGMDRINLAKHAIIAPTTSLRLLAGFMGMTLSLREESLRKNPSPSTNMPCAITNMKESLLVLFTNFRQSNNHTGRTWNAFRLVENKFSDLLIFVNALRHHHDANSICLDAHIVPLTGERVRRMSKPLTKMVRENLLLGINVTKDEAILWKKVMPALVERCRYSWDHKSTCEYGKQPDFTFPRSLLHGESPICSCGEGQDTSDLPEAFADFSPIATRIAISPLSAVPYVEPMAFDAIFSATMPHTTGGEHSKQPGEVCGQCRTANGGLKLCNGCGKVKYCSKDCQVKAWKAHKKGCKGRKG